MWTERAEVNFLLFHFNRTVVKLCKFHMTNIYMQNSIHIHIIYVNYMDTLALT